MGVRRRIATAAGVTIASLGIPLATAAAASAAPAPTVCGTITGLHTIVLCPGETAVVGELLRPDTFGYTSSVPVVAVSVSSTGVVTVTTGSTFLPLGRSNENTNFTVVSVPATSSTTTTQPGTPPPPPPPPPHHHGWA